MHPAPIPTPSTGSRAARLRGALERAAHLLPAQGPIGTFVHHNTLHAFQHLPFHEALAAASETFGAESYLSEARYLELYRLGRITVDDLLAVLEEEGITTRPRAPAPSSRARGEEGATPAPRSLNPASPHREAEEPVEALFAPERLALLALLHPVPPETASSLRWRLTELSAARHLRENLSEKARRRFLVASRTGLRRWLDRVARDWTLTTLASALLDPTLGDSVRAAALSIQRVLPMGVALRSLGIPHARAADYLVRVKEAVRDTPALTMERWLSAEATLLPRALAAAFGGDGGWASLWEQLERDCEPLAVAALWSQCQAQRLTAWSPPSHEPEPVRSHRELLLAATGVDVGDWLHPLLIRVCGAFLDEGFSHWPMPHRRGGLYAAWLALRRAGLGAELPWLRPPEQDHGDSASSSEDVVLDVLEALGVPEARWEPYLVRVLRALPGWAGMFHRLEHDTTRPAEAPPVRLMDFLAVRLLLERDALEAAAREHLGHQGPLTALADVARDVPRAEAGAPPREEGSWRFFQWMQHLGVSAMEVAALPPRRGQLLLEAIERFSPSTRRRLWHEAHERHYRQQLAWGLARNRLRPEAEREVRAPRFQVWFCMDDREESIRRHFEEQDARHETFGIAGFFGVAFDYQGMDDARAVALCPVVMTPAHVVEEHPLPAEGARARLRARLRAHGAKLQHGLDHGSQALEVAWLLTPVLGLLSLVLLPFQVLLPRGLEQLRRVLASTFLPTPRTRLTDLREPTDAEPGAKPRGFTVDEQAQRVASALEGLGLVEGFAPLVVVLGHGAASVNNPHRAAYDCGACGGRQGGPNARLFARMANRPEVRARLRERGIALPDTTWFLGGLHDTTTDEVHLYDLDDVPARLRGELSALRGALDRARALSAHERCRRFDSAPGMLSPTQALRHVEARAADLGQPRPELGHAMNAVCIVGRRALTRGLFLDRRAFLISYDPRRDASGAIIERLLLAAAPVGAGISLEYYFSHVDNERHGCGTKLPHNLTGLLGVMDGPESDLRTGLPRQMVELHEPMRLLLVVEASVTVLSAILERQPALRELVAQAWVQLVSVDPTTGAQRRFTPRGFQPVDTPDTPLPRAASSPDWYAGQRGFLPPALIRGASGTTPLEGEAHGAP